MPVALDVSKRRFVRGAEMYIGVAETVTGTTASERRTSGSPVTALAVCSSRRTDTCVAAADERANETWTTE